VVRTFRVAGAECRHYCIPASIEMWVQPYVHRSVVHPSGVELIQRQQLASLRNIGAFFDNTRYHIYPHLRSMVASDEPVVLLRQHATWLLLQTRTRKLTFSKSASSPIYLIVEWRCRLWSQYFLEHSVRSASQLDALNYCMRLENFGFYTHGLESAPTSVTIQLTSEDISIIQQK
jgi:hypothetical protein